MRRLSSVLVCVLAACGGRDSTPAQRPVTPPQAVSLPAAGGALEFYVTGFPPGHPTMVGRLTGSGGFSRDIQLASGVIQRMVGLPAGRYTVTWANVSFTDPTRPDGARRYVPSSSSENADVVVGATPPRLQTSYADAAGQVGVTVFGLPANSDSYDVATVFGANGASKVISVTPGRQWTGQFAPGSYVLQWDTVRFSKNNIPLRYASSSPPQQIVVDPTGQFVQVSTTFEIASGSLEFRVAGLPLGGSSVTVGQLTGPNSFSRSIDLIPGTSARIYELEPGEYRMAWSVRDIRGVRYHAMPAAHRIVVKPGLNPTLVTTTFSAP